MSNQLKGKLIGKYKSICCGVGLASPDFPFALFTGLIILGPSIIHCVYTDPGIVPANTKDNKQGDRKASKEPYLLYPPRHQNQVIDEAHIQNNVQAYNQNQNSLTDHAIEQQASPIPNKNSSSRILQDKKDTNHIAIDIENNIQSNKENVENENQNQSPAKNTGGDKDELFENYVVVRGVEIVVNHCRSCNIIRPPRAFHCSRCNICVEVHGMILENICAQDFKSLLDHHCPWVGTCIGKRNHRYFVLFLQWTSFHAIFTFITGLISVLNDYHTTVQDFYINVPCWVIMIYGAFIAIMLLPFAAYHWWLIGTGKTTNEEVRGKYQKWGQNPFDFGCKRNCKSICQKYPSQIYSEQTIKSSDVVEYEYLRRPIPQILLDNDID
ncbi:probable palmitoyltransferase zdhhc8-like [Stylonychia lemnae]|uniref:Palmitoyltransferase n=1 Tax=Stylonychia lemnae TaxID=5949 RepID=A0A078B454_STYLE|nr:probable palmitoyltransferase zdhhc8-like [Stylonychia lemnae]|eukprot:CDW89026.1 probable palmitoyltransferase zdhhc8-like [Stylonychia lemnae]